MGAADVLVVLVVVAAARTYVKTENWKDNACISWLVLVLENEPAVPEEAGGCDSATDLQASFDCSLEMNATMQATSASALSLMLY